jgi:hypothetical protein
MSEVGQMTAPRWGVPDWRNEDAYPGSETKMYEWSWQFLRRRPDYREFWLKHAKVEFERSCKFAEIMQEDDPEYPTPEWYRGWVVKKSFFGGISSTLDPSFPHYKPGIFEPKGGGHSVWRAKYDDETAAWNNGLMSIEFDLKSPIAKQLERAERLLKTEQAARFGEIGKGLRNHTTKWHTYLRVIDARDDGQSWSTIARKILRYTRNEPQAARQVWEQAQRLMFKTGC